MEVVCCCDKMRETSFGFTVAHHDREITSAGALGSWFQRIHGQEEEGGEHCAQLASSTVQAPRQWFHPQRMCLPTSINPQIIVNRRAQRPDSQVILDLNKGLSITGFVLYSSVHYSPAHSKRYQSFFLVVTHRTKGKMFQK